MNNNLYGNYTIYECTQKYELSANYNIYKNRYYMPWITFKNIQNKKYPSQNLTWDNVDFIFGDFYKFLLHYLDRYVSEKEKNLFADIYAEINDEEANILLEMLQEGIKLGWNKL